MTVNAGDIVRATAEMILPDAGVNQNVYHYLAGAGVAAPDAAVMDTLRTFLDLSHAHLNGVTDTQCIPTNIKFQVSTDGGVTYSDMGERGWVTFVPAAAGDMLPPQSAFLAHFGAAGTGQLGSKYLGGFAESESVNGVVQASAFVAIVNYINQVVQQPGVAGGVMMPGWREKTTGIFRVYNATATVPTAVATQRRRKDGVGL